LTRNSGINFGTVTHRPTKGKIIETFNDQNFPTGLKLLKKEPEIVNNPKITAKILDGFI
jgi:hypothetical protein